MLPLPTGYAFPDDNVPESEKAENKFGLHCAQALYARYSLYSGNFVDNVQVGYGWGHGDVDNLRIIELYGRSNQPMEKYKAWFANFSQTGHPLRAGSRVDNGQNPQGNSRLRKAYANIDYTRVNPLEKFASIIISILSENDYKTDCTSTDQTVVEERVKAKLEALYTTKLVNPLAKQIGLPEAPTVHAPQSQEEADWMEEASFFKSNIEVALENLAENCFRISNWKNIRRFYNRNAIDFYYRCVKVYNDPITHAVKVKFIDIKNLVMLWTKEADYEPVAIGHVENKKVQDIYPQLVAAGFSDKQISQMAQKYAVEQTTAYPDWTFQRPDPVTGQWLWMDFLIPVMEFEYLSTDYKQYVRGKDKKGNEFYKKNDAPVKDKDKTGDREYDDYKCNTWYRGNYICGTDLVYGWEKMPNQLHKNKLNPVSSYVFDHIPGTAPTQRVIGLCDDLMQGVLKLRAAVYAAAPAGFRVDIGAGANIMIGDQEFSPFDLFHLYRQNGILVTASKYNAATGKVLSTPIEPIQGGLGAAAQEWMNYCIYKQNEIAEMLGIPAILASAQDQSDEKAVGVAEMEYISGTHALYPLKESEILFKQRVAEKIILMSRMDIKYDPKIRKYYEGVIGKDAIEVLDTIQDMTLEQLGITMKAMPNQKRKDLMMMRLSELAKMGTRDGIMIITPSELETFEDLLTNDQMEQAKWYLARCEEKAMARAERNRTAATQETAAAQQQSAVVAEQAKQQTAQMQHGFDLEKIRVQGEDTRLTQREKYQFETQKDLTTQAQKGEIESEQIVLEGTIEAATGENINNPRKT